MSELTFVMVVRQTPEKIIEIKYDDGHKAVTTTCKFSDADSFRQNVLAMFEIIERDLA